VSGHSKWANIKRRKAKVDEQRGKLFTKLGRELIIAARQGGPDPAGNMRLKMAIQKAKDANMPQDTIARAIQKGSGELEGVSYEEVVYEGYGPSGVALLINIATDNRNRTAGEIRHILSRNGGNLGESGCVAWMFNRKGVLTVSASESKLSEDDLMLLALEAGAEDMQTESGSYEITTAPEAFDPVKTAFTEAGVQLTEAEITMVPQTTVEINDKEEAQRLLRLIDLLEDHDDVQSVVANFEIPEPLLQAIMNED
jgi:YebC/PmpR family DNA-binding regulatory protein